MTAAISAGSRRFVGRLLTDDVLVGERQGEVAHRLLEVGHHRHHDQHEQTEADRASSDRRRRARRPPVPHAGAAASARALPHLRPKDSRHKHGKNRRQLRLELRDASVVDDRIRRSLRLFRLRELTGGALGQRLVSARAGPLRAHPFIGDHGDRGVEARGPCPIQTTAAPRLPPPAAAGRRPQPLAKTRDAGPDPRPEQTLEPLALLRPGKRGRASAARSTAPVRGHRGPEARHHGVAHLRRSVELVHDRIGRKHRRAQPLQCGERGRFPGADPAGQPDERAPSRSQVRRGRVVVRRAGRSARPAPRRLPALAVCRRLLGIRSRRRRGLRRATSASAGATSASVSAARPRPQPGNPGLRTGPRTDSSSGSRS